MSKWALKTAHPHLLRAAVLPDWPSGPHLGALFIKPPHGCQELRQHLSCLLQDVLADGR
jgi:hypothetical protein